MDHICTIVIIFFTIFLTVQFIEIQKRNQPYLRLIMTSVGTYFIWIKLSRSMRVVGLMLLKLLMLNKQKEKKHFFLMIYILSTAIHTFTQVQQCDTCTLLEYFHRKLLYGICMYFYLSNTLNSELLLIMEYYQTITQESKCFFYH